MNLPATFVGLHFTEKSMRKTGSIIFARFPPGTSKGNSPVIPASGTFDINKVYVLRQVHSSLLF